MDRPCLRCGLDAERCRCTRLERTLDEERHDDELARRREVRPLTTALRTWAHLLMPEDRPLEESRAKAQPFLTAAGELDARPLSGWCAEYLPPVLAVLERELSERQQGRWWSVPFARVTVPELEVAIATLRARAVPLYQSRREAAE